jgi:signal transduction histidine kinase
MRDHTLIMKVEDDGNGFDPTSAKGRGLINVTERARQLDGTVTLEPGQLTGTRVTWIARRLD